MNRNDEAHAACLNILDDSPHSAVRVTELCTLSRALGREIDDLRAQLVACAAGPWRTDVENAPKDNEMGVWFAVPSYRPGRKFETRTYYWNEYSGMWMDENAHSLHDAHAFAVPQVKP